MAQNIYDDPDFFAKYAQLPRSMHGLDVAYEWPVFRGLLPDLADTHVLDLGCGTGGLARRLREMGAARVEGVDISEKMLAKARSLTDDTAITYRRGDLETIDAANGSFDLIVSSLAFHYVERFEDLCRGVASALRPGGAFVFSIEHPMTTARVEQDWCVDPDGIRRHWPVDTYNNEGPRQTNWLGSPVIKYHRTVAGYVNAVLAAGLDLVQLAEPVPDAAFIEVHPRLADEVRRPPFLLLKARKRSGMDLDQYALATTSEDYREAIRAFLEKREPKFTGR